MNTVHKHTNLLYKTFILYENLCRFSCAHFFINPGFGSDRPAILWVYGARYCKPNDKKKDTNGTYFRAGGRNEFIVYFTNKNYFKLFDPGYHLLEEGSIVSTCVDCMGRDGRWIEYYTDGVIKQVGNYYRDAPIGTWILYYPNGRTEKTFHLTIDGRPSLNNPPITYYSGEYLEYYANGNLKTSGLYRLGLDSNVVDTTEVYHPTDNTVSLKIERHTRTNNLKCGAWKYYNEKGEMTKEEYFD